MNFDHGGDDEFVDYTRQKLMKTVDYTRQKVVVSVDYTRQEEVNAMNHEVLKRGNLRSARSYQKARIADRGIVLEKDTNNVLTGCGRKPVFCFPY